MSQKKVPQNARLPFENISQFFEGCLAAPGPAARTKLFRSFLNERLNREADDLYQVFRLILPGVRCLFCQRGALAYLGQTRVHLGSP